MKSKTLIAALAVVALSACGEKRAAGKAAGGEWSRVPRDEPVLDVGDEQEMYSVAAGGPGLVAVGYDGSDAAVWLSKNGRSWTRLPRNKVSQGGVADRAMRSVTAGGPGLVAVGCENCSSDPDPAVWLSKDGRSWTRVPYAEEVFGGADEHEMYSVTAGGPGLVAVGSDGNDAAVWLSRDSRSWTRLPRNKVSQGGVADRAMRSVTAGGPGLVAVGCENCGGGADAAVWLSKDGRSWTRVPHAEEVFGGADEQEMLSVVVGGPGLVAVGYDGSSGDWNAAVWLSKDGRSWTRVPRGNVVQGSAGELQMLSVTAGGPGLVAVGYDIPVWFSDAAVWLSEDGRSWTRVRGTKAVFGGRYDKEMHSVTAIGSRLVAVGFDFSGGDSDAAVWLSLPGSD